VIAALKIQPVCEDPLNAFAKEALDDEAKRSLVETEEIKRRLFDYKPFENQEPTPTTTTAEITTAESDFIFEKIEQPLIRTVVKEEPVEDNFSRSHTDDNASYYETGDDYEEEEEEDDEPEDESFYEEDSNDSYDSGDEDDDSNQLPVRSNESVRSINGSIQSGRSVVETAQQSGEAVSLKSGLASPPARPQVPVGSNNSGGGFETPSTMTNKLSMFMKRMETSIEISGKLKGQVSKFLSEKGSELKDAMLTSSVSPQEVVTNKLRSFSNYQLNPGQYLNGLVKSNSTFAGGYSQAAGGAETPTSSFQRKLFERQRSVIEPVESAKLDLEPFPDDESYKAISVKWWGLEQDGDGKRVVSEAEEEARRQVLVDVRISSCNM